MSKWEIEKLKAELEKMRRSGVRELKGTVDTFDDSLVGNIIDENGNEVTDEAQLEAMGFYGHRLDL